jgi:rhodanese-related sulfurtransferase
MAADRVPAISCSDARVLVELGAQLVDVREPQEYRQGALPGAVNVPLPVIQQALHLLDRDNPVLVYCATGRRSGMAKYLLEAHGFSEVHNIGSQAFFNDCS